LHERPAIVTSHTPGGSRNALSREITFAAEGYASRVAFTPLPEVRQSPPEERCCRRTGQVSTGSEKRDWELVGRVSRAHLVSAARKNQRASGARWLFESYVDFDAIRR
jgi:hypothetical protein